MKKFGFLTLFMGLTLVTLPPIFARDKALAAQLKNTPSDSIVEVTVKYLGEENGEQNVSKAIEILFDELIKDPASKSIQSTVRILQKIAECESEESLVRLNNLVNMLFPGFFNKAVTEISTKLTPSQGVASGNWGAALYGDDKATPDEATLTWAATLFEQLSKIQGRKSTFLQDAFIPLFKQDANKFNKLLSKPDVWDPLIDKLLVGIHLKYGKETTRMVLEALNKAEPRVLPTLASLQEFRLNEGYIKIAHEILDIALSIKPEILDHFYLQSLKVGLLDEVSSDTPGAKSAFELLINKMLNPTINTIFDKRDPLFLTTLLKHYLKRGKSFSAESPIKKDFDKQIERIYVLAFDIEDISALTHLEFNTVPLTKKVVKAFLRKKIEQKKLAVMSSRSQTQENRLLGLNEFFSVPAMSAFLEHIKSNEKFGQELQDAIDERTRIVNEAIEAAAKAKADQETLAEQDRRAIEKQAKDEAAAKALAGQQQSESKNAKTFLQEHGTFLVVSGVIGATALGTIIYHRFQLRKKISLAIAEINALRKEFAVQGDSRDTNYLKQKQLIIDRLGLKDYVADIDKHLEEDQQIQSVPVVG